MNGPDLVDALLNLLFFPFSLSDNSLFLVVFGVFLFCFSFSGCRICLLIGRFQFSDV